jgi:hypothetical protein
MYDIACCGGSVVEIKVLTDAIEDLDGFELFEIHPECRYAIIVKETLPDEIIVKLSEMLKQWLLSGDKFLVVNGDVALVRLNGTENVDD